MTVTTKTMTRTIAKQQREQCIVRYRANCVKMHWMLCLLRILYLEISWHYSFSSVNKGGDKGPSSIESHSIRSCHALTQWVIHSLYSWQQSSVALNTSPSANQIQWPSFTVFFHVLPPIQSTKAGISCPMSFCTACQCPTQVTLGIQYAGW